MTGEDNKSPHEAGGKEGRMEITIKGSAKEIAALALELQGRQIQNFNALSEDMLKILLPASDDTREEVRPK